MSSTSAYDDSAAQVRRPTSAIRRDDRELIRTATLAASSHNTQPWTFSVTPDAIVVHADLDRRCPVVDPDDAHLYKSLGCAAENMVQAAVTQGIAATVTVDAARGEVTVNLEKDTTPEPNALSNAIFRRQCTRAAYDGTPVSAEQLAVLEHAGTLGAARCLIRTDTDDLGRVAEFVSKGNLTHLNDPSFRQELVSWIRFNPSAALATRDGLAGRATGQPAVPTWFGTALQRLLIKADKQAALDAERLASSAGVAVIVTPGNEPFHWVDAGRAYQRFALQAEVFDIRTAFINQPIEVPELRPEFESWMGLSGARAQLAVRFGHGPRTPDSLRRDVDDVIVADKT